MVLYCISLPYGTVLYLTTAWGVGRWAWCVVCGVRRYRLSFPDRWRSTLSPSGLDSRMSDLNDFFARFMQWTVTLEAASHAGGSDLHKLFQMVCAPL